MKEMAPKSWLDAARRTMSWLSTQLRADGGWTHSDDCGAYFKSIPAFTAHGMLAEAQRCVNYVAKNFLTDDGDIRNSARVKSDDGVYEQHADTYFNYLVALGAWRLGRFDVAFPVVDHIAARHVGATGGFLIQRAGADAVGQQDIFSTGGGTVAMLTAGRLDGALQGGAVAVESSAETRRVANALLPHRQTRPIDQRVCRGRAETIPDGPITAGSNVRASRHRIRGVGIVIPGYRERSLS